MRDGGRDLAGRFGGALTFADQVVSSGTNFALGVFVARVGGPAALGAFGVLFGVWLVVLGTGRALVYEPMTVDGATSGATAQRAGAGAAAVLGLAAAAVLGAVASACWLVGFAPGTALLMLAPWLPVLVVQDYCRMLAFRLGRPGQALAGDLAFLAAQAVLSVLLVVGRVTALPALVAAWGMGAAAGMCVGVLVSGARPWARGGPRFIRALWPHSRWFLAEFGASFSTTQGYVVVLPILLGVATFGQYRAGLGLLGPMVVLFLAGGNLGLPGCVASLQRGGVPGLHDYTRWLSRAVVTVALPYCAVVAVFAAPLLELVYGARFTEAGGITRLLCLDYAIAAVAVGRGVALRAAGRLRRLWALRALSGVCWLLGMAALVPAFGLLGAGWAAVGGAAVYAVGIALAYRTMRDRSPGPHAQVGLAADARQQET